MISYIFTHIYSSLFYCTTISYRLVNTLDSLDFSTLTDILFNILYFGNYLFFTLSIMRPTKHLVWTKCHHCLPQATGLCSPSVTDRYLSLSIIYTHAPQPNPSPLCSGRFSLVLGATLSDGMTNDFSLASLCTHTHTADKTEEHAVQTHRCS